MLYTIEEIVTGKKVSFPQMKIDDLRNNFTDLVYENEKKIYQSFKQSYPSAFDNYLTKFVLIDASDLCTNVVGIVDPAKCSLIFNGILLRGLRTSIVSFTESKKKNTKYKNNFFNISKQ